MRDAPVIETERLRLHRFHVDDAPGFFALNADVEVVRYTGDTTFASVEEAEALIRGYANYERDGFGRWSVYQRETGEYLGFCGLSYRPQLDEVDVGFRLQRRFWGQGYATEAARASLRHGFDALDLARIVGRAREDNAASHRVLQKLGMRFEKEFRDPTDGSRWLQYELRREWGLPG
jgi:[ribosomal protein S5]-alanine N-acetyltransferase